MKSDDKNTDKKKPTSGSAKDADRKSQQQPSPPGKGGQSSDKSQGSRSQSGGAQDPGQRRDR